MHENQLDCYFSIARQHLVCEDYAIVGTQPTPYIILCDGCSSSAQTDIGARLIALSAKKAFTNHFTAFPDRFPDYDELGCAVINTARQAAALLELENSCLDATLLAAVVCGEMFGVYVYGDGYVVTVNNAGELAYRKYAYNQNMPYYLTYWADESRRAQYEAQNNGGNNALTITEYAHEHEQTHAMNCGDSVFWTIPINSYALLALTSDGAASFLLPDSNQKVSVKEIFEQLVGYKTTKGDFVKRRTRRMLKEFEQQGIYPTDDVSVATILL